MSKSLGEFELITTHKIKATTLCDLIASTALLLSGIGLRKD